MLKQTKLRFDKLENGRKPASKLGKWVCLALVLVWAGLILSACDDGPSPQQVQNDVKTAMVITNATPAPTFPPGQDFGLSLVILGPLVYYPANPGERVKVNIVNTNAKSFFVSNCDGLVLQRKDGDKWLDIAPGRACPPQGGNPFQIGPFSDPIEADFIFNHHTTYTYTGQSWDVPGTYRLYLTYYLACPPGSQWAKDCIDVHHYDSNEFEVKAGTTIKQDPTVSVSPKAVQGPNLLATPTAK